MIERAHLPLLIIDNFHDLYQTLALRKPTLTIYD